MAVGETTQYGAPVVGEVTPIVDINAPLKDGQTYQITINGDAPSGTAQTFPNWQQEFIYGIVDTIESYRSAKVKSVVLTETSQGIGAVVQFKYYGTTCPNCAEATVLPLIPIAVIVTAISGVIGLWIAGGIISNVAESAGLQIAIIIGTLAVVLVGGMLLVNAIKGKDQGFSATREGVVIRV